MLSRIAYIAVLFSIMLGASACNTIEGAGEDVESAGESIQEEAAEF